MHWYERDDGRSRLAAEKGLLDLDFPQMELLFCGDGRIRVHGTVGPNDFCCMEYYVVAELPPTYPHGRIHVWLPYERMPSSTPHVFSHAEGEICIDHGDFDPDDCVCTLLGWVVQWIALYEHFLVTEEKW